MMTGFCGFCQFPVKNFVFFKTRGRCYDHNFLRFFPIFGEKISVFLKYQCYDQLFSKFSFVLSQKRQFFAIFLPKIFKNHNVGPCLMYDPIFCI
jgi:hypothetical protein